MIRAMAVGTALLSVAATAQVALAPADRDAAFRAAGFLNTGGVWRGCDDPGTAGYTPGSIEQVEDVNGDNLPEAVITESSSFCYGAAGAGYVVVSKQGPARWRRITQGTGMVRFLKTKGVGGWPDIEIGGPGFCFPIERWNGREYVRVRFEYEGKRCTPAG